MCTYALTRELIVNLRLRSRSDWAGMEFFGGPAVASLSRPMGSLSLASNGVLPVRRHPSLVPLVSCLAARCPRTRTDQSLWGECNLKSEPHGGSFTGRWGYCLSPSARGLDCVDGPRDFSTLLSPLSTRSVLFCLIDELCELRREKDGPMIIHLMRTD